MARLVALLLLLAGVCGAVDAVHKHMEPAPPVPARPYVKNPLGLRAAFQTSGILALATRRETVVSALIGALIFMPQATRTRLMMHFVYFVGSLLEPYDSLLPKKSFLRVFIMAVQKGKRDYDVSMDDQTFFDNEDEVLSEQKEDDSSEDDDSRATDQDDAADEKVDSAIADETIDC
ncbi:MAG: hypothetical protein SGPRY_002298 [Prymnesium sp.]